jgi:hypothetical protein
LTNSSDYSPNSIIIINSDKFYQPLSNGFEDNPHRKIINNDIYFYKKNRCKITVDYDVSNYYPTSGITVRQFKIKKISFEYPLPVKTSGSYAMPANAKSQSGSYLLSINSANNSNTASFSLSATYNNITISGTGTLNSSKTSISFYIS